MCPFIPAECGSTNVINLMGTGDQMCLELKGLQAGNACLYQVNSACRQPTFSFNELVQENFITYVK
jgi:hypothetical protein